MTYQQTKSDIYERVTDRIVAGLEDALERRNAGHGYKLPWTMTAAGGEPRSLHGKSYRGINWALLKMLATVYPSQLFGTYHGWQERGGQVRKGEKGIPVVFWKWLKVADKDTGEDTEIPFARGFTVFGAEQVDGFDLDAYMKRQAEALPDVAERIEAAERAFAGYQDREGLPVRHGGNRAFYSPGADVVQMPAREAFRSSEGYYSTLAHELTHSTGHQRRLSRQYGKRFGDHAYAVEELVAELGAAMLCGSLGIEAEPREDHADYIASWLRVLKDDKRAVVSAAAHAQKAADLVLATTDADEEGMRDAA